MILAHVGLIQTVINNDGHWSLSSSLPGIFCENYFHREIYTCTLTVHHIIAQRLLNSHHHHHMSSYKFVNIHMIFWNLNLPKCNQKCCKGYKQICILLKWLKNGTFWVKCQIFAIFRTMPTSGVTKCWVALNSASIYSSYNFIL